MDFGRSTGALQLPLVVIVVLILLVLFAAFGTIGTGNVGVRTTFGVISANEVTPGVYLKWPVISKVEEFTSKEVPIDLTDLTPKAKDNLSLRDMDVTVYYRAKADSVSELQSKYAGQSVRSDQGYYLPAYELVFRVARNTVYEAVAEVDSLVMHTRRESISSRIMDNMQRQLDASDAGVFKVTRVVVRSVSTDPSIEESIRAAVSNQKKLEAMQVQTEIAKKEAEIKITEAEGIAQANRIIAGSLTREYLQHEANLALLKFAEKGNSHTVVIPSGMAVTPLINTAAPGK
jgi:regulator of protease activity HflC (stomatin/prohibitin superfamily)